MPRRHLLPAACAALALTVVACASAGNQQQLNIATATFAPQLGVDLGAMLRTSSGLYEQDVTTGSGPTARRSSWVTVAYRGWLADGTVIDSSETGRPISFPLGARRVIDAWDEAIPGMKVGGTRRLVVPPRLGYGSHGEGKIPPNAILVFDIMLMATR
jgi:FKBP-type peptidyl-prolyl cis-trans isomerase FkpA